MRNLKKVLLGFLTAVAAGFGSHAAHAAPLSISDVPLFLSLNAEPNIVFLLDDSGSMQWEIMPDDLVSAYYMFPRGSSVYGGSDYANYVVNFNSGDILNRHLRSAANNKIFYNPAVTYEPWSKADGTQYSDVTPSCAPYNPHAPGRGCLDLTSTHTATLWWRDSGGWDWDTRSYYPATYYNFTGTNPWDVNDYAEVVIQPGTTSYVTASSRTDCAAAPVCSYDEEIQNFANWYSYYRSRILLARAGAGFAFAQQGKGMRVGFATLNKDDDTVDLDDTRAMVSGVRPFDGADREDFFDNLYGVDIPQAGTPLRSALQAVGEYYRRTDNRGPWGAEPGSNSVEAQLACRQSYTIAMTDGYWSDPDNWLNVANEFSGDPDDFVSVADADNINGPSIPRPSGGSYQYVPEDPYRHSSGVPVSLADVAMHYWNHDLRPDLDNKVPPSPVDEAYWQHMVTFAVGLGVTGTIDPQDVYDAVDAGTAINWPNPFDSNAGKTDDLLHAGVNSRGGFYSAGDPQAFASGLANSLDAIVGRVSSAAAVATNSTRLDTNTLIYQARFDSENWTGQLIAYDINPDGTVGSAVWEASSLIPGHASRDIFTWDTNTAAGVDFEWANLNAAQKAALDQDIIGTVDGLGADRVAYLRGDASQEGNNGGTFRNRQSRLGDIINSDPAYVGTPDLAYSILTGNSGDEGLDYQAFRQTTGYQNRSKMLYVGGNDGMLHAFDAETGVEKFAFIPNAVIPNLTDLTSPDYTHKYYVDGAPRAGDAYINGNWRTVLVGSTGAGGKAVFALDVTTPDSMDAGDVMWEFTDPELGVTIGQPTIARLKAGESWVAIFGNGYNSTTQTARLFIVDLEDGSLLKVIDTEVGDATNPNGLGTPIPVDQNGDRVTDYVYAGDLQGNLWKFDMTSNTANGWDVAFASGGNPAPLFKACSDTACTDPRPITVRPTVGRHPDGGLMVYFGTGKYFEVGDNQVTAATSIESFYGIRDLDAPVGDRSELQIQTIVAEQDSGAAGTDFDVRAVSANTVDYATKSGWVLDLDSPVAGDPEGERVISTAILRFGRIIFTTVIPSTDACDFGGRSWLMELDAINGSRLSYSVFDANGDGIINDADFITLDDGTKVPVSGRGMDGIGKTPGIISAGGGGDGENEYKYTSTSDGNIVVTEEKGGGEYFGRQSWRQLD